MPNITVYVWLPDRDHVGHSSLKLSDGTYISWWPEKDCGPSNPRAKACPMDTLEEDIIGEGNRHPQEYRINLSNEELTAVKQWWEGFRKKADYQFISNNCSTVAYYAQEAAFPFLSTLNDEIKVWVPTAVQMVAQDLADGKRSLDRNRINEIKKAADEEVKRLAGGSMKANNFKIGFKGRK